MTNYLNNPEIDKPEAEEIQPQDFLYREIRDKHPQLSGVSKREYANNFGLQEELEGVRIDGTTWRDDFDFEEDMNVNNEVKYQFEEDYRTDEYNQEEENEFAHGGEDYSSSTGNRLTEFYGGGTHEENSLGGIPIGIGANGKMNSVEEGETRYEFDTGGYIFSNRIDTKGLFRDL